MSSTSEAQVGNIIKLPGEGDNLFVVESAGPKGGGIGHHSEDVYAPGHHVVARLLGDGNAYDASARAVEFYQSGELDPAQVTIIPEVEVVGNMQRSFVNAEAAPEPVDLPAAPEPVDLPVDPEPVDLPVDPEPVDLPAAPEPVDLPVDPEPVEAPSGPPDGPGPVSFPSDPPDGDDLAVDSD